MWTPSSLTRALLGFAAVQVLALASLAALSGYGPPAAGTPGTAATLPPALQRLAVSELDALRVDAAAGDLFAGRLLVAQLLERYEREGDTDHLFEAVQWMDRAWESGEYQLAGLATRVFERHCGQKVMRWHWLCTSGE